MDSEEVLRLATRAEWRGDSPGAGAGWLAERGVEVSSRLSARCTASTRGRASAAGWHNISARQEGARS
jgi:hypothetical protein